MHMQKPSLSNKVFTENPLLDEIVYNARQLATGVVVKDDAKANNNETLQSIQYGDVLIAIGRGEASFENFRYDEYILSQYYTSPTEVRKYAENNKLIPESDKEFLFEIARREFLENYEEYNNYYRMLHGLPDYDPKGMWEGLFIDIDQIDYSSPTPMEYIHAFRWDAVSATYTCPVCGAEVPRLSTHCENCDSHFDAPIYGGSYYPIHELDLASKNTLFENGTCENLFNDQAKLAELQDEVGSVWEINKDSIMYVLHIGDREVDYYDARNADRFSLLYCPGCSSEEVKIRFTDLYEANRLYFLYTMYSSAYRLRSDYYDNFVMIFLIIQTVIDMIVELPEYLIRRDVFDARTCKYIFESNGVKYFRDIPLKYQVSLVKNLNKLIKFKSTDRCIVDILSIFGVENIEVFRYYIMKDRNLKDYYEDEEGNKIPIYYDEQKETTDSNGVTTISEDNDKNYELKFIRVPMLGNYDDNIRKDINIYSYDTLVDTDAYWIGDKTYESVKEGVKDLDFTVLRSKYYSIEAVIDLAKRNFTVVYFMNLLMYNKIDSSKLKVNLPNISTTKKFEIIDAILTLYSLSYIYYNVEDTIIDSRSKACQILGFNMEADLTEIDNWLFENHRGLTVRDLHVDTFQVPEDGQIMSFSQLEEMFYANTDCYDHVKFMLTNPPTKGIYDAYKHIDQVLFTMNRNMEYFLIGDNPVVDEYKELGYTSKFVEIPRSEIPHCANCSALVNLRAIEEGDNVCPICGKPITIDYEYYHNQEDFNRDYTTFVDSADEQTLYFVLRDDFDTSHMYDLYIKQDGAMVNVGTARMAFTYREFLRYKDAALYSYLSQIVNITNVDSRREACVNGIQSIVSYLKDYIDQDGDDAIPLDTVFSGLPSVSMDFVKKYIEEVIDYFKSFKIFTHGSSIMYVISEKFENYVKLVEWTLFRYLFDKSELIKIEDQFRGKTTVFGDRLVDSGPGLGVEFSHEDRFKMIDKVWFDISRMVQKYYSEYYDSDNYRQADLRIHDTIERFVNIQVDDKVLEEKYITELEIYAVDVILDFLVSLTKEDKIELGEFTGFHYTEEFDEYYNEWLADLTQLIMVNITKEDYMNIEDDITRSDFYDFTTIYKILEGRASSNVSFIFDERTRFSDSYSSIITQDFPPYSPEDE